MNSTDRLSSNDASQILSSLRDLSDFCVHWEKLKPYVSRQILKESKIPDDALEVIMWLVEHADRTAMYPNTDD